MEGPQKKTSPGTGHDPLTAFVDTRQKRSAHECTLLAGQNRTEGDTNLAALLEEIVAEKRVVGAIDTRQCLSQRRQIAASAIFAIINWPRVRPLRR